MRKLLLVLVSLLISGQAWAADWHVCPATDAADVELNYGTEDGTSEANCFDGNADAWATAGDIDAGDTVYYHGTFYHEHIYPLDSGTSGNPITLNFEDALSWYSVDVSGANTVSGGTFGQTTGSSWQLVSGTAGIYKKGTGTRPYLMWVDGERIPNSNTAVSANTDAGAIAVLSAGQYISTSEDLDGLANSLYYYGTPTSDMRVNNQSEYPNDYSNGGIISYDYDYIAFVNPQVRGYRVNLDEAGGLYIQGCTGCTVTDPVLYENIYGARFYANTGLAVSGSACQIHSNIGTGVGLSGAYILASAGDPQQIDQVSQAADGLVTTKVNHGLTTGDVVVISSMTGMTGIEDIDLTATVASDTTFTIGVNTTGEVAYGNDTGLLWIKKASGGIQGTTFDCGTPGVEGTGVYNNGSGPNFTSGTTPTWSLDGDGVGVGYNGGTVNDLVVSGSRIVENGPQRAIAGGEGGTLQRGCGMFVGTSYANSVNRLRVQGNQFEGNHRCNFNATDTISFSFNGNMLGGVINLDATAGTYGQIRVLGYNGVTDYKINNNSIYGESGSYAIGLTNDHASQVWNVNNNAIGAVTKSSLTATWNGALYLTTTTASVTDRENRFISATDDAFFKRSSTQYDTVAEWDTAISQTTGDEIITDFGWVGGAAPTDPDDFRLSADSVLRRAGRDLNIGGYQDCAGRAFLHPPSIGACEATSGDKSPARTQSATRNPRL